MTILLTGQSAAPMLNTAGARVAQQQYDEHSASGALLTEDTAGEEGSLFALLSALPALTELPEQDAAALAELAGAATEQEGELASALQPSPTGYHPGMGPVLSAAVTGSALQAAQRDILPSAVPAAVAQHSLLVDTALSSAPGTHALPTVANPEAAVSSPLFATSTASPATTAALVLPLVPQNPEAAASVAAASSVVLSPAAAADSKLASPLVQLAETPAIKQNEVLLKPAMALADGLSLQRFLHQQVAALPAATAQNATSTLALAAVQHSPVAQWQSLALPDAPATWGSKLLAVLSDKVMLQMGQQMQRAQIRLDPPQLGSIELRIAVEGEKTAVQIFAANPQVREAMQQTLDLLRLQLAQQLGENTLIDVQLGDSSAQQQPFFTGEAAIAIQTELTEPDKQETAAFSGNVGWLNRLA